MPTIKEICKCICKRNNKRLDVPNEKVHLIIDDDKRDRVLMEIEYELMEKSLGSLLAMNTFNLGYGRLTNTDYWDINIRNINPDHKPSLIVDFDVESIYPKVFLTPEAVNMLRDFNKLKEALQLN